MKQISFRLVGFILMLVLFACKKDPVDPPTGPKPGEGSLERVIRLTLKNLPAQPVNANYNTLVTIKDSRNGAVRSKKLAVQHDQQYFTDTVILQKGIYSLTGVLVREGNSNVKFAAPIEGSARANGVAKPLNITMALDAKEEKRIEVELLPVSDTDTPESFGYPAGSFGDRTTDPELPTDTRIFVKPMIKVGDIVYDSVPVQLVLKSWDEQNNMSYKALSLLAGMQPVVLPAGAVKYQLSVSKWNTYDEMTLTKGDIQENSVYILGGNKGAKLLKNVTDVRIENGRSKAFQRFEYRYQPNGDLKELTWLGKKEDGSNYVIRKDLFQYTNSRITGIQGYNESGALSMNSSFSYDNEGRVTGFEQAFQGQKTTGAYTYLPVQDDEGTGKLYSIGAEFSHTDRYYKTYLSKLMYGGIVLKETVSTSHGNFEEGLYDYDFNINPYAHLAIPDMFLSQISKHNLTRQSKTWSTPNAIFVPMDWRYTYDADGYPTQLFVKYREYDGQQEVYTIRTIFEYY
ncbi:hypothetical protein [Pollutibacter soli]|uniref:hypothetical protein n=1 Tax=Pollutibacter soli TaxID=3034157 RepID=UPI0030137B97